MKPPQIANLEIFADYYQFYIRDGGVRPYAPTEWSNEDVKRRVKVANSIIVICPVRNMTVQTIIEVHQIKPKISLEVYDHVVICSLDIPSGILQVHECTGGEVLRLNVPKGSFQALILMSNLDKISEDGLDGDDGYRVVLWPDEEISLNVVKEWQGTINAE